MKHSLILQTQIHLSYHHEPLHPIFESCIDGEKSLRSMEEKVFNHLKHLEEMFPFCDDFHFIKKQGMTEDGELIRWYDLEGEIESKELENMTSWIFEEGRIGIEKMNIPKIEFALNQLNFTINHTVQSPEAKEDSKKQANIFTYFLNKLLPERSHKPYPYL